MASCTKCGKPRLNKQDTGFVCKRCGVLPGPKRANRSGFVPAKQSRPLGERQAQE